MPNPSNTIPQSHTRTAQTCSYTEAVANLFRPAAALTSLEYTAGPFSVLTVPELDALLEVILMTLNGYPEQPEYGTIRLAGQYRYRIPEYQMIFGAHLRSGSNPVPKQAPYIGSSERTLAAIQAAAHATTEQDSPGFCSIYCPLTNLPDSSIYLHDDYRTLILNTTYGRFLASIDTDLRSNDIEDLTLWVIAETLACLRPHDQVLQQSVQELTKIREEEDNSFGNDLTQTVRHLFGQDQSSPSPSYRTDQPGAFHSSTNHFAQYPALRSWRNCANLDRVSQDPLCYFEQNLSKR